MSMYEKLSSERKLGQEEGVVPEWMTTAGYAMFMQKYIEPGGSVRDRYEKVAQTAGAIANELYPSNKDYEQEFFRIIWNGWLSPATPILANLGTDRGLAVSCTGNFVGDSIWDFYSSRLESAMLTKHGFGTSSYLGDIRPRGSSFADGNGKANGIMPVVKGFVQDMNDVSQGSQRRGAWAGYLPIDHDDFHELIDYLLHKGDGLNIGWNISNEFIDRLKAGDKEAIERYQKVLKTRAITGKGYMLFIDKVNDQNPEAYKKHGLTVKASNLCAEIELFSDEDHSFSCVLSSLNLAKLDEYETELDNVVKLATVFLDCVAEDLIRRGSKINGLDNVIRFTKKSRALGLGVMGWHEYLQRHMLAFDSDEAYEINSNLFSKIRMYADESSRELSEIAGEPEWCVGTGKRNTHQLACAPTMSTALIVGGTSQGIEPLVANAYTQASAAGEFSRVNPTLIEIMKQRGKYDNDTIVDLIDHSGSVQHVDWLDDQEKLVFRTAYEIPQEALIRQASDRQRFIDQGQSLNLFFSAGEDPKYVAKIHKMAMFDPYIKALYYLRSQSGVSASRGKKGGK